MINIIVDDECTTIMFYFIEVLSFEDKRLLSDQEEIIFLDQEALRIPYRVYFDEPDQDKESELTIFQKSILNCIFLRHHNGYIRQKRLKALIDKVDYFIIPYTFQLLGEYVVEILYDVNEHINRNNIGSYLKFIRENDKYGRLTENRMISYWNEYYRIGCHNFDDYIGSKIFGRFNLK